MSSETPPDSQSTQPTYKDQLSVTAKAARHLSADPDNSSNPGLMEKVADYVPGAAKVLGTGTDKNDQAQREEAAAAAPKPTSSTPSRPKHDDHIAEFIRDQHRSKKPEWTDGS